MPTSTVPRRPSKRPSSANTLTPSMTINLRPARRFGSAVGTNSRCDTNSDRDAHTDANSRCDTNSDRDAHSRCDTNSDRDANAHAGQLLRRGHLLQEKL